jgi:hypothetical protein
MRCCRRFGAATLRDDAPATDVVQAARDLVGLHATGAPNPYLHLFTRMPRFTRPALDHELYERRSLARVRCMRGALFLLPLDRLPIAWAATRDLALGPSTKYLAAQGMTPRSYERWASLVDAVVAGRALFAAQIRAELGAGPDVALPTVAPAPQVRCAWYAMAWRPRLIHRLRGLRASPPP